MAAGLDKRTVKPTGCEVLLDEASIESAVVPTQAGFDLLPGNRDLTAAELKLMDTLAREARIKEDREKQGARDKTSGMEGTDSRQMQSNKARTAEDGGLRPSEGEEVARGEGEGEAGEGKGEGERQEQRR